MLTQILTDLPEIGLREEDNSTHETVGFLILEGKKHEFKRGDTKIGRDPTVCSIVIDNFTVSKVHSVIESEGKEDTFIYDAGSTNLTKLGKKILKPHYRYKLENGSVITFGNIIGTVDLATELEENPTQLSPVESTAFKIGGPVTNYSKPVVNGDIFDLETQVSQLPREPEIRPSTSTDIFKTTSNRASKDSNAPSLPKWNDQPKKNHLSQFRKAVNLKSPAKHVVYGSLEDSNIFNMMTQEQIYSPKTNSQGSTNADEVVTKETQNVCADKSLLDDGQDDIFCHFENLKFLNKDNTSTPLKPNCEPASSSRNEEFHKKPAITICKSLQSDFEINREIDLIRNDVEINRSFDEDFFCEAVDSPKVFKEPSTENECHSPGKLTQSLNISEPRSITKDKKQESCERNKESACNGGEKYLSQSTLDNFKSFKVESPSKAISPSYLNITLSDDYEPSNKSNRYNSEHESIKILNNTFQHKSEKYIVSQKEDIVRDEFSRVFIKKELQMIPNASDDETEMVLENVGDQNFGNSNSSELHRILKKPTDPHIDKDVTNAAEVKTSRSQNIKLALEEEFSSDSDEFIGTQVLRSQASPNKSLNSSEETQIEDLALKSLAIHDLHDQKSPNSFLIESNTNWSFDFIHTPDSASRGSAAKKLFKEHLNSMQENSLVQKDQKQVTPLTQTKDLNAFVPESSEDDDTPSDLEIIGESPYGNIKPKVNSKIEGREIKEESNSTKLNQPDQFEGNENENSDISYIFDIDDGSENDKRKDNNKENYNNKEIAVNPKRLPNNLEVPKTKLLSDNIKSPDRATQSSDSETPDLILGPEHILNEKQVDSDSINQKFNLCEGADNSDEINCPNTQILEDTLIKIIEEDNKENEKQSSRSSSSGAKAMQNEIEKTRTFSKDSNPIYNTNKNLQSHSVQEPPRKRNSDGETSIAAACKRVKQDSNAVNQSDEEASKNKEEEILNFWQVPDIAQVLPKKAAQPKYLLNQQRIVSETPDKVDNLHSEEFNSNNGLALSKISCANVTAKMQKGDLSGNSFLSKKPVGRKSGVKKDSPAKGVPLEITFTTRVLRSVSKHYGTSIVSRNPVVTSCARNLLNGSPTRASLKRTLRPNVVSDETYFSRLPVNVVFTGFDSPCLDKIIQELGGNRSDDLKSGHVVVTDRVRRTVKFLCAIGLSLPIVSPDWLLASKKENTFLNPWNYILKDDESEERWDFDLRSALEKAKRKKFLQSFHVFATESVKPPPKDMLLIAECCGAFPLTGRSENWPKKTLVLTCEEDKDSWPPLKFRSVKILHFEFLLSGVLQQQVDFKTFQLR